MSIEITLDEGQRQFLLLSLALMVKERPGWNLPAEAISEKLRGREMYDEFLRLQQPPKKPG
jgi:hypothetical protein